MAVNYRTHQPQTVTGFGGTQTVTYAGKCAVCGRNTYRIDGADPDPRGHIDEFHAAKTLSASEHDKHGPDIVICWECGNSSETYNRAMEISKTVWADSLWCDGGDDQEHPCYRLDTGGGSGLFLCREHWRKEMDWRKERNKELDPDSRFDILPWPGK